MPRTFRLLSGDDGDRVTNSPPHPVPRATPGSPSPEHGASITVKPVAGIDRSAAFHCRETVAQVVTPNDFPRLISLVRTLAPEAGTARNLGDGLLWEHDSGFTALSLTINPEAAGTVIRADLRTDGRLVASYLGAAGLGILGGLMADNSLPLLPSLGIGLATAVGAGLVARALWQQSTGRTRAQVERLVASIAAAIRGQLE